MFTVRTAILSIFVLFAAACTRFSGYAPKAGDIVFQDLESSQGQAVKLATGSQYTHCGIVFETNGNFVVCDAVGPVRTIPLQEWIRKGVNHHVVAKRLDTLRQNLSKETLEQMRKVAESHLGKEYDPVFDWSDDRMYCSELVWKVYQEGMGFELTPLKQLGSFRLDHPIVKAQLHERYGDSIPLAQPVVAPSDLFDSENLKLVYSN
jgi:uncharacterized protein YycO